ncbi:MAG: FAD-binding protein [Candidatus Aminicenantes bacterium]|nr:FAD-binding protein [Candidatus Aminicenantes bacterium]
MSRVQEHPILRIPESEQVTFVFAGRPLTGRKGEMISSALFSNGIRVFGRHHKDGSPQGIFCANGQCSQCLVIADGLPVKSCMVPVREGMNVLSLQGFPELPPVSSADLKMAAIEDMSCDLLVVGGGPAGMGAAIEAADSGISVILVDDKSALGGKLVLQTHLFFGAAAECYAGTRGIEIAGILADEVAKRRGIKVMTSSVAVGVFADKKVGVASGDRYSLVTPRSLLVASGAREKALNFPGCDLPGVYGAGAFQTLLNRDLIRPSERLFVVGGGNVGLIAAYHALQAGISVVGLCEALPDVGGYWVHSDKIRRMGVPIYTTTSVVSANGRDAVESVTVARVDKNWKIVPGTHKTYACDTLLIAVGLDRVNEFHDMAVSVGLRSYLAGDAEEIAEASAAMFSGRVTGRRIARDLGMDVEIPEAWERMTQLLKSHPGRENFPVVRALDGGNGRGAKKDIFPVVGCLETIPCNPCSVVCPQQALKMPSGDILQRPEFDGDCVGCSKCVANCPGLAITLVDMTRRASGKARVTVPFELPVRFEVGDSVAVVGWKGEPLGQAKVLEILDRSGRSPCRLACPADVRAQGYIQLIRKGSYAEAIGLIRRDLPLPGVCGRVCYHPCEEGCLRKEIDEPVAICALKRFVSDWARANAVDVRTLPVTRPQRIAVIGSGPAGLACANELAHRGYAVTVFEAAEKAGGLLRWGIPAYRLPDDVLDYELDCLARLGITFETGKRVSDVNELFERGFAAVFLAPGALKATSAGIPGEDLEGVVNMLDFLRRVKTGELTRLSGRVAVIGGGNSAIDSARVARRLGAEEVRILYRRSREQMPSHDWEVKQAEDEGIRFDFLVAPEAILGSNGRAGLVRLIRMKLGEPDASGRARPVPIPGSEFELPFDTIIPAIGQQTSLGGLSEGMALTRQGNVIADPVTQLTRPDGVFAGGDAVTGADTVVAAFGAGKRAAESIDRFLRGVDVAEGRRAEPAKAPETLRENVKPVPRAKEEELPLAERLDNMKEIVRTLSEEAALAEASRCLGCGSIGECLPGIDPGTGAARRSPIQDKAHMIVVEVDPAIAARVGGIRIQPESVSEPIGTVLPGQTPDDTIVCRCERVTAGEIRRLIREGERDINQIKAVTRACMGACGAKTCTPLIHRLFREEGVPAGEIVDQPKRPLFIEVPMGAFAGLEEEGDHDRR